MTPSDLSTVEARIAQLAGESQAPARTPHAASDTVAAFTALLGPLPAASTEYPDRVAALARTPADLECLIAHAAAASGVDPRLVEAVAANESGFDPRATSVVGAAGVMQLMPETAAALGVRDAYDAAENIAGGTRYLAQLLRRFGGDVTAAVAAYNAGPEAVARGSLPAETVAYVRAVLDTYAVNRTSPDAKTGR